jgi:hypothetical protein
MKVEKMNLEKDACLLKLERVKWYGNGGTVWGIGQNDGELLTLPESEFLEDEWKDTYERRR